MNVKMKFFLPMFAVIGIVSAGLIIALLNVLDFIKAEELHQWAKSVNENFNKQVLNELDNNRATAAFFSESKYVRQGFQKAREGSVGGYDIEKLREGRMHIRSNISATLRSYKREMGKDIRMQFHLPPSTSFYKTWNLRSSVKSDERMENEFEELGSYRASVKDVNSGAKGKVLGLELGESGVMIRAVLPVKTASGEHLGSVETFTSFDKFYKDFTNEAKAWAFYLIRDKISNAGHLRELDARNENLGNSFITLLSTDDEIIGKAVSNELLQKVLKSDENVYHDVINKMRVAVIPVKNYKGELIALGVQVRDTQKLYGEFEKINIGVVAAAILLMIIIWVTVILLSNSIIIEPLEKGAEYAEDVAEGKLTVDIDDKQKKRSDEFGTLLQSMGRLVSSIVSVLKNIKRSADATREQSSTLSEKMQQNSVTVKQIVGGIDAVNKNVRNQIEQVDTAFDNNKKQSEAVMAVSSDVVNIADKTSKLDEIIQSQSSNVNQIVSSIQEMSASIGNVNEITVKADTSTERVAEASKQSKEIIEHTNENMSRVLEAVGTINDFVSVIVNIAGQTNLLAMNAAIEAAHAGDVGRGFAVVAEEIRKLAEMSNSEAENAKKSLNKIEESVQTTADSLGEADESFSTLLNEINNVSGIISEVRGSSEEQNIAAKEIVTAITDVSELTQNVKSEYTEINEAIEHIKGNIEKVQKLSEETDKSLENVELTSKDIGRSMNEISEGAEGVKEVTESLVDLTKSSKESVNKLESLLTKFDFGDNGHDRGVAQIEADTTRSEEEQHELSKPL